MLIKKTIFYGKKDFSTLIYEPSEKSDIFVLHINMVNVVKEIISLFNIPNWNKNYYFACYDAIGQGESKRKTTRFNFKYVNDIRDFIIAIKKTMPHIKKIYLTGESWGANLVMMFLKKNSDLINGCVCWNAPAKVANISSKRIDKNNDSQFLLTVKTIFTIVSNIEKKFNPPSLSLLTNNPIYLRSSHMRGVENGGGSSIKAIIACWTSMIPSWRFIKKYFKKNSGPRITYIQSKEDVYLKKNIKNFNFIQKNTSGKNKTILLDKGFHLLSVDSNSSHLIWKELNEIIFSE